MNYLPISTGLKAARGARKILCFSGPWVLKHEKNQPPLGRTGSPALRRQIPVRVRRWRHSETFRAEFLNMIEHVSGDIEERMRWQY